MKIQFKTLTINPSPTGTTYLEGNDHLPTEMQVMIRAISMFAQQPDQTFVSVELYTFDSLNTYISKGEVTVTIPGIYHEYSQDLRMLVAEELYSKGLINTPPTHYENTLQITKDEKLAEILAIRDGLETRGFMYLDKLFDSDAVSVTRILGLAAAAQSAITLNQEMSVEWTVADNSTITLSTQDIVGLPLALANHSNALHIKAKQLKLRIEAAETEAEVLSITWEML